MNNTSTKFNSFLGLAVALGLQSAVAATPDAPIARDFIVQLDSPVDSARGERSLGGLMRVLPRDAAVEAIGQTMPWARVRFDGAVYTSAAVQEIADQMARLPGVERVVANTLKQRRDIMRVRESEVESDWEPGPAAEALGWRDLLIGFRDWIKGPGYERLKPKKPPAVRPTRLVQDSGSDPLYAQDWAMQNIRVPLQTRAGAPVIAGVIDTGVDYNHPDLRNSMWRSSRNPAVVGYDFAHKNERPYDLVQFDPEAYIKCTQNKRCANDPVTLNGLMSNAGHGTHCSGHIGAVADNALGVRAPGSSTQVVALKVFQDAGEANAGSAETVSIVRAIDYAIANGVRVVNESLGALQNREEAMKSAEFAALARARAAGILVVVAAGNDSLDQDKFAMADFPAAYTTVLDNVIAVAATTPQDELAEFSNFGGLSVQLAAPGTKVLSTISGGGYGDQQARLVSPSGKVFEIDWDGTSFSAPLVTGAAARIWSEFPKLNYLQVKDAIVGSARRVPALAGKVVTGGILDVGAALERARVLDAQRSSEVRAN